MRKSSVRAPNTTQRRQLKRVRTLDVECGLVTKASFARLNRRLFHAGGGVWRIDLTRIEGIASHYDVARRAGGAGFYKALPNRHRVVWNRILFWPLIPSRRAAGDRVQRFGDQGYGPSVDQAQSAGLQQP